MCVAGTTFRSTTRPARYSYVYNTTASSEQQQ